MNTYHKLKISSYYFNDVANEIKTFEIRYNDRDYRVGDFLQLNEFDNITQRYTGRYVIARILYILQNEKYLQHKCVGLAIDVVAKHMTEMQRSDP